MLLFAECNAAVSAPCFALVVLLHLACVDVKRLPLFAGDYLACRAYFAKVDIALATSTEAETRLRAAIAMLAPAPWKEDLALVMDAMAMLQAKYATVDARTNASLTWTNVGAWLDPRYTTSKAVTSFKMVR